MEATSFLMPFGKYEGQAVEGLPGTYLVQLYTNREVMEKHPAVKQYIEINYGPLLPTKKTTGPICDTLKAAFVDRDAADKELKRIRKDPRKHKKPVRSYECERCGFWHHTSREL